VVLKKRRGGKRNTTALLALQRKEKEVCLILSFFFSSLCEGGKEANETKKKDQKFLPRLLLPPPKNPDRKGKRGSLTEFYNQRTKEKILPLPKGLGKRDGSGRKKKRANGWVLRRETIKGTRKRRAFFR